MQWLDANAIIDQLGPTAVWLVSIMIFLETGIIVTSFLPGDSLLFLLGLAIAADSKMLPIWLAVPLIFAMAFAGSQFSFELGARIGLPLVEKNKLWFLTPKLLAKSHEYFEKYGARAVVLARFVPILRAVIPAFAGISYLERRSFIKYNLIGAAAWIGGMMLAGYFLGSVEVVKQHLETAILIVVVVTSLPFPIELLREAIKARREKKTTS